MHTRPTFALFILSLLMFSAGLQVLGQDSQPLSKEQVLELLPRSIDMLGANDQANYQRLVSQGAQIHEYLGQELLRSTDWITAGRIIAIFVDSKGDKTTSLKYLKQFLELSKTDDMWPSVRTQAATAIRKLEGAEAVQSPTPKQDDARGTKPTPKAGKLPASKPTPSLPTEEPSSSTPWSIIVVLIVAALGLLWLVLKRRS